jgi:hypothetical protein
MGHAGLGHTFPENSLQFGQQPRPTIEHSFLAQSIEAAEAYLDSRGTEAQLNAALVKAKRDIHSFLDRAQKLDFPLCSELAEVLQDSLSLITDFRDGPVDQEQVSLFTVDARHFHSDLVVLCASSFAHKLKKLETQVTLQAELASEVPTSELTQGLYQSIRLALQKGKSKEAVCQYLESNYDRVVEQLRSFRTFIAPTLSASDACLGDRLVLRGLTSWLEGIEFLQESVLFDRKALSSAGLERLLEGNRSLVLAKRLLR